MFHHLPFRPPSGTRVSRNRQTSRFPPSQFCFWTPCKQAHQHICINFGEPFVKATYRLEGDESLAFSAYEEIVKLQATISAQNFPNITAVANKLSSNRPTQKQQLINYATECIKPAIGYFKQKFEGDLKPIVTAFKYARYFDPAKVSELCPSSADIDQLKAFPFLNDKLEDLKVELPIYMAKADGVSPTIDKLKWWKKHSNELPH